MPNTARGLSGSYRQFGSLKVYVADDDRTATTILWTYLHNLGHDDVQKASDGAELKIKTLANKPDFIITDYRMPKMNGIQALQHILDIYDVPVIVITGESAPDFIDDLVNSKGVIGYLPKPFSQIDLDATIAMTMRYFKEREAAQKEREETARKLKEYEARFQQHETQLLEATASHLEFVMPDTTADQRKEGLINEARLTGKSTFDIAIAALKLVEAAKRNALSQPRHV